MKIKKQRMMRVMMSMTRRRIETKLKECVINVHKIECDCPCLVTLWRMTMMMRMQMKTKKKSMHGIVCVHARVYVCGGGRDARDTDQR